MTNQLILICVTLTLILYQLFSFNFQTTENIEDQVNLRSKLFFNDPKITIIMIVQIILVFNN